MNWKQWFEEFKKLSPATQVMLVIFALAIVVLLVAYPTASTSIIAFLLALKSLSAQ